MEVLRNLVAWAAIAALSGPLAAEPAVELSRTGHGGALVVPIWSVGGGENPADGSTHTLLSLTNHANAPVAVKLRVIGRFGEQAGSFNVYLDAWAGFTAALSAGAGDGQAALLTRDGSCLVPDFEPADDSGLKRLVLPGTADGGVIEIIEMGRAAPDSGLTQENGIRMSDLVRWIDCGLLTSRFDGPWQVDPADGLLPPLGALSADVQLLDVEAGADASFAAVAIAGFSDVVQHTPPDAPTPNLSTAHTPGTGSGTTSSRVCTRIDCRDYEWDRPIDALASVLTTRSLFGEAVVNPGIGAATEMVLSHPLARYDAGTGSLADPVLWLHDRDGAAVSPVVETPELSPPPPKGDPLALPAAGPAETYQVVSFSAAPGGGLASPGVSALLRLPVTASVSLAGTGVVAVRAEVEFFQSFEQKLVSRDGSVFEGLPVIGLIVRQFANGTLEYPPGSGQQVLSNYRGPEPMSRRRAVRPPFVTEIQ